jgi:O-acetyl-ADP-ribose deacetylase (regulator of RNase III)
VYYGFPKILAAEIAVREIRLGLSFYPQLAKVFLVCFDEASREAYEAAPGKQ